MFIANNKHESFTLPYISILQLNENAKHFLLRCSNADPAKKK